MLHPLAPSTRCVLASAPHRDTFGYSMPPPGLLRLGGELLRRGRPVALEDLAFRVGSGDLALDAELGPSAAELLLDRAGELGDGPLLIGLSTMGATLPAALLIAAALRERAPEAVIALGGPGCGGLDAALLGRFEQVDLVVRGEGEITLPELLERMDRCQAGPRHRQARRTGLRGVGLRGYTFRDLDLRAFPGITWRDPAGAVRREGDRPQLLDLNQLAAPAWELLAPLTEYKRITGEAEGLTPIDSGRGCVYDCSFCSIGRYWGRRSRALPAERLVAEMLALREHEGARNAYLCHDLFGGDRKHALLVCALLEDALENGEPPVPWECRARIDHLDGELLEAMGRAGCYRVLLGVESGDGALRNAHDKHMDAALDVPAAVARAAAAGVTPILSCILGLPGESDAELARTLDAAADSALVAGVNLSFHLPNPQPGCKLGDERGDTRAVEGIPPDMAFGAGTSLAERALIEAHPDLFSTWHLLTDQAGGEERLAELATIAKELSVVLMRFPRSFAALRRARGLDSLALFRAWRASELSFEGFALSARDALVRELLGWEQALLRASARGERGSLAPGAAPRKLCETLTAERDLPTVATALRTGDPLPPAGTPTTLAILPGAGDPWGGSGVRTVKVGSGVERVLALLDGRTLDQLEQDAPGVTAALEGLAANGLVELAPAAPADASTHLAATPGRTT